MHIVINALPIPDSLSDKYHGCGQALAAIADGQIVDLVYLDDIAPNYGDYEYDDDEEPPLQEVDLSDPRVEPTYERLKALGQVISGMCSCRKFLVLGP